MSLIADALKSAQREKERQRGIDGIREQRARSIVGTRPGAGTTLRVPRAGTTAPNASRRGLVAAVGAGVVAILSVGALAVVTRGVPTPGTEPIPAATDAPPPPTGATLAALDKDSAATTPQTAGPLQTEESATESAPVARAETPPATAPVAEPESAPPAARENARYSLSGPDADGRDLLARAASAHRRREFTEAVRLYEQAAASGLRSAEVFTNLGAARRELGRLSAAREAYREAIAIDPRYATAWSNLGVVLDELGQESDARDAYQRALDLDPANTGARVNLGIQYIGIGMLSEARKLLEDAVRTAPELAEAHYALGTLYARTGEQTRMVQEFERFLETSGGRFPEYERVVRQLLARR